MMWEGHDSKMLVAAHRGERFLAPENTMTAFQMSIDAGVDMIETDVRMTKDHELVLMHDERVDRTTDGYGLIRDMTLREFKALNTAQDFDGHGFEAAPTLEEFLAFCARQNNMLIDFELKEYPVEGRDQWAYECCDRTIEMLEKYGFGDRCVLNSFSGKLLEYIVAKYGNKYRIHGYYPYDIVFGASRNPKEYIYCLCVQPNRKDRDGKYVRMNSNVPPKAYFDEVLAAGIHPWVCGGLHSREELQMCFERGANLLTADYSLQAIRDLRALGLHD